jgi:hypothetical protein
MWKNERGASLEEPIEQTATIKKNFNAHIQEFRPAYGLKTVRDT